jgi:hypothetical protein
MGWLQHNEGIYTHLGRTFHREENGGYEMWSFEVRGKKYFYFADIRIPGLVNAAFQEMPKEREKVIVIDFASEQGLNTLDLFTPTGDLGYEARVVLGCIAELTIRIIEPIRKYRYVAVSSNSKFKNIFKKVTKRLGSPAESNIVKRVYDVLNPDLQLSVDIGTAFLSVGDLISNPDWRNNNHLPPL